MAAHGVAAPLEGIGFGAAVDYFGLEVDGWSGMFLLRRRHGSRRCGAAGYRWRIQLTYVQREVGAAWRRGDVVGRTGEVYADLDLEDCLED